MTWQKSLELSQQARAKKLQAEAGEQRDNGGGRILLLSLCMRACCQERGESTPLRPSTLGGERRGSPRAHMRLLPIEEVLQVPFRTAGRTFKLIYTTTFSLPVDLFGGMIHW